ncbi:MAG TPA: DUF4433 domain-containing protein [Flavilitoribacter sp.]|nr:DUF4433 domain-containing protein [Flavilitoribacter sp.]HMQ89409.1 DUF4433 domain-containing protein [Flavilitoribacter sp.]
MLEIYRIIHRDNLDYILRSKRVVAPAHAGADPDYISIGDNEIIKKRAQRTIPIRTERTFQNYVAFYFGYRSIMLFNIHTGFGNVLKHEQEFIIYLVFNVHKIVESGLDYFFTDGQGNQRNTRFFDDLAQIDQVDLNAAYATNWSAEAQQLDPDIKRKKHAEFHIFNEVPIVFLSYIAVQNESARLFVSPIIQRHSLQIPVIIKPEFYY